MVGNVCLDKATDYEGNPAPITFEVRKVMNGHEVWETGGGSRYLETGFRCLEDAVKSVHDQFIRHLEDDRWTAGNSFWLENYQAARSKWQTWAKQKRHSFRYDNYSVCIVTSNGDLVW